MAGKSDIVITAGLAIDASTDLIKSQIPALESRLASEGVAVKIGCTINAKDLNIKELQQSLNKAVGSGMKLDVSDNLSKKVTNKMVQDFNNAFNMIGKMGEQNKKTFNAQTKQMLQEFKDAYNTSLQTGDLKAYDDALASLQSRVSFFAKGDLELLKQQMADLRREFTDGLAVSIGSNLQGWLNNATGSKAMTAEYLDAVYGSGKWKYSAGNAGFDTVSSIEIQEMADRILSAGQKIINIQNKLKQGGWGFDELINQGMSAEELYSRIEDRLREIVGLPAAIRTTTEDLSSYEVLYDPNATAQIEQRTAATENLNNAISQEVALSSELAGFEEILSAKDNAEADAVQQKAVAYQAAVASLENLKAQYAEMYNGSTVTSDWIKTAEGNLEGFTIRVQESSGQVQQFKYKLDELGQANLDKILGSDKGIESAFRKATNEANRLERQIISIKAMADDKAAARPIVSEEGIKAVTDAYDKAKVAIDAVRAANAETYADLDNEARKAVDNLNNVIKAQRNAETAATKLRSKPIEVIKQEELAHLNEFVTTLSSSAIPDIAILSEKANQLKTQLSGIGQGDKQGLTDYLNNFSTLKAEFNSINTQAKTVKSTIAELDRIMSSSQFAKNASNPQVVTQFQDVKTLKADLQAVFTEIGNVGTPEALSAVATKLTDLKTRIDSTITSSKELQQALIDVSRSNTDADAIVSKIASAYKEIDSYKQKSVKAGEMANDVYAQEISRLEQIIALSKQELQNQGLLTKEVQAQIAEIERKSQVKSEIRTATGLDQEEQQRKRLVEAEQKQLEIERQLREETQKQYWDNRFKESIKDITAENEELKKLKQYLLEIDQAAQNFTGTKKSLSTSIYSKINSLTSQASSSVFVNNTNVPNVQAQITDINNLKTAYEDLLTLWNQAQTPQALAEISTRLQELSPEFDRVSSATKDLKANLAEERSLIQWNNRVQTLSANMDKFASANANAINSTKQMSKGVTFAEEWTRMTTQMAKGANLTDAELRQLTNDFRVFGIEAQSAGLKGESGLQRLKKTLSFLAPYFSSYRIVSTIISNIKSAVNELKSLDDILTEIAKVSNRTKDELTALGQSAFDVASKYGRTASDYLTGVQEMSRAGFAGEQAEQLAELSLRAQAAGYMTAEMANEYIVATNAGYELQGSIEKLNQVLDGQVYVTDRNALNMENLAEATKMAASQASSAGVGIDELTAAVGTMISVTQQGGAQAGRAFRGKLFAPYRCESISA